MKKTAFILLTLALLLCLCPAFAAGTGDEDLRPLDTEPPTVTGITLSTATVTAPGTITVTVTAADDVSGIIDDQARNRVMFRNVATDTELYAFLETDDDGKLRGTINVGANTNAGTYTIEYLQLTDKAGNCAFYNGKGSSGYAWSENKLPDDLAEITFEVQNTAPVDTEPPKVTGITLNISTVTAPGATTVTVTAADDVSGIIDDQARNRVMFRNVATDTELYAFLEMDGDGKLRGTIDVGANMNTGTYTIEYLQLTDKAGSCAFYSGKGSDAYATAEQKLPDDLAGTSFVVIDPASIFTGIVTYRSGKEAYLQEGDRGLVALLDSSNAQADLDAVQVGKRVTVTGEAVTMNRSGYHIPEIVDAMIVEVKDTEATVAPATATIDQLNDGLMARLVRVKATKKTLAAANLQLDLDKYQEEQVLTVTGVLSADIHGRVLLGATIQAEHVPGQPVKENEVAPTCTEAGSYDEVTYCAVCNEELSRVRKTVPALGHAPGEPVKENEVPATATAGGSYDEVVYCTRCHAELSRVHKTTEKLPAPPTFKTQPKSANVKSGSKAKFTVKVKEKNVTYQWLSKAPGAADWTELPGETKATLTVVASKANSGTQYRCRVRTAEGGEAYTNPATLTVKIQPPAIKTQPKNLAVVSGKKAKFTVKASGPKLTYTWYSRPNAEAAWTPVAGQTKNSLTIVASKANDGSQYYCKVQNTDGEKETAIVTLTVTPEVPAIKTQPKDAKVKIGAKAKFKVKATGKNVTYQWYYRTSETGEWVLMEGETSATLTVTATAEKIGWQFRCQARNADGFANSNPATLRQK